MQANVNDGTFGALFVTVIIGAVLYLAFRYKKYGRYGYSRYGYHRYGYGYGYGSKNKKSKYGFDYIRTRLSKKKHETPYQYIEDDED